MGTFRHNLKQIQLGGNTIQDGHASYPDNLADIISPYQFWVNNNEGDPALFTIGDKGNPIRISGGKLTEETFDSLMARWWKKDENGDVYSEHNVYSLQGVSALGRSTGGSGGGNGGSTSLGGLVNVDPAVDDIFDYDIITYKPAGATHFTSKKLSEVVGLDKDALSSYLTTNGYATQTWVNEQGFLKSVSWDSINNKPTTFAPSAHKHTVSDITDFPTQWAWSAISGKPSTFYTLPNASASVLGGVKVGSGLAIDANGILSANLSASHIPGLDASKIISGTLADARIPSLSASKITSGTFDVERIPTLGIGKISGLQTALDNKLNVSTFDKLFTPIYENGVLKRIQANFDFYSVGGMSALGWSEGGSGTGSGLIQQVHAYGELGGTFSNTNLTSTFNAYTTNQIHLRVKALEENTPLTFVSSGTGNVITGLSKAGNIVTYNLGLTALTGITKAMVEAVLTGVITSHTHNYLSAITKAQVEAVLTGLITSHYHDILQFNPTGLSAATYGDYGGMLQSSSIGPSNGTWYNHIKILHSNSAGYYTELAQSFTGTEGLYHRRMVAGTVSAWRTVWDSGNSNLSTVNWTANTLTANTLASLGGLTVAGAASIAGALKVSSGLEVTGLGQFNNNLQATGAIIGSSTAQATRFISTIATGTAPLQVNSTTLVNNLNAQYLGGYDNSMYFQAQRSSLAIASSMPTTAELADMKGLGSHYIGFTGASGHLIVSALTGGSTRYVQFYSVYNSGMYWRNSTDSTLSSKPWRLIYDSYNSNSTSFSWSASSLTLAGALSGATTGAFSSNVTVGGTLVVTGESAFGSSVSFSSRLTIDTTGRVYPYSTSTRRAGMYGVYDSTKAGHVWSIGTSYVIADDGSSFGNLYGMAYAHSNSGLHLISSQHQILFVSNGTANVAIGLEGVIRAKSYITSDARFYTGYDSGIANSISCSNYFRSNGSTGWYNTTHGAGIIADEAGVVRTYSTNRFKIYSTAESETASANALYCAGGGAFGGNLWSNKGVSALGYSGSSDMRLKENISDFEAINILASLKIFSYTWNKLAKSLSAGYNNDAVRYGFSAQELEKSFPQMVTSFIGGYKAVDYFQFIAITAKGVVEVNNKYEKLEKRIKALEQENKQLKERLEYAGI